MSMSITSRVRRSFMLREKAMIVGSSLGFASQEI